jgi:hypothetical protein
VQLKRYLCLRQAPGQARSWAGDGPARARKEATLGHYPVAGFQRRSKSLIARGLVTDSRALEGYRVSQYSAPHKCAA